ncbi:MAG: hypothetical protein ACK49D_04045 [Flavobacteriia bacterium]|jgi:hypothetical protein
MNKVKLLACMLLIEMIGNAQSYVRTGKNFGFFLGGAPIATTASNMKQLSTNTLSFSAGFMKMPIPGITFSAGYGYSQFKHASPTMRTFPYSSAHSVMGSILADKRIAKLQQKKVRGMCHYLSLGLLVGVDYTYMFGSRLLPNESNGEIAGQVGLSFCHVYSGSGKRTRSQTNHFDVFYRQGFTPAITLTNTGEKLSYYRCELGIRVRLMRHQVYDFLK